MKSILDAAVPAWGRLPHLGLMRFTGLDAHAFLQGQLSNDTRRLSAGATLLAAYSSPQGRVLAVLHLLPHSSGVIALLPREILLPTLERLRKYVLRSKVQIEDLSERFAVLGRRNGERASNSGSARSYVEQGGVGVAAVGSYDGREWAIGEMQDLQRHGLLQDTDLAPGAAHDHPADVGRAEHDWPAAVRPPEAEHDWRLADIRPPRAEHDWQADIRPPRAEHDRQADIRPSRAEHDWRLADIRAGLPQVYAATSEMFVAQMLNLDLIDGISFTKGCFTGQEIIARTQHLGRIKRRMFRLRLPAGSFTVGQAVHLVDGRAGRLTELASTDGGYEALAVLNMDPGGPAAVGAASAPEAVDPESASNVRIEAAELPLPYPLLPA